MRIPFLAILLGIAAWPGWLSADAPPWPVAIEAGEGIVRIHPPQIDSFEGNFLSFRTAVTIEAKDQPVRHGALWLDARVLTDHEQNSARLYDLKISNLRWPEGFNLSAEELQTALNAKTLLIPLRSLIPAANRAQQRAAETRGLPEIAPSILLAYEPSILVPFCEEPRAIKMPGSNLMRVVDSPVLIILNPSLRRYYMRGSTAWYSAANVKGPYELEPIVPENILKLAPLPEGSTEDSHPKIHTSTGPAELIVLDGPERFVAVPGTNLLRLANTRANLFLSIETRELFFLSGGRWFSAPNISGPWKSVSATELSADFALLPSSFAKPEVLSAVIGTQENAESILRYHIPQTAAIKSDQRIALVEYDGQPDFVLAEGTEVEVAANTVHDVVKVLGRYYCCSQGVWYVSDTAIGPFTVTGTIPSAIYSIPPSSAGYHMTFVHAFSGDLQGMIWFGYYPGYLGSYLSNGTVVWGTGIHYPAWIGLRYISRPTTWGFAPAYEPGTLKWKFCEGQAQVKGWFANSLDPDPKWWGVNEFPQKDDSSSNIYRKLPERLAVDPIFQPVPQKTSADILVVDDEGYVNRRDFSGYQRWENGSWSRVADPEQEKRLDLIARDLE